MIKTKIQFSVLDSATILISHIYTSWISSSGRQP